MPTASSPYKPQEATYFDLINDTLQFKPEELSLLERNGFVLSDRLAFDQFRRAYAYIYWKDLPVLITTDSMLHALHQTYDNMLKQVELTILTTKLIELLSETRAWLRTAPKDERLAAYYADLDFYLSVPLVLLDDNYLQDVSERVIDYVQGILLINGLRFHKAFPRRPYDGNYMEESVVKRTAPDIGIEHLTLFGFQREIDFSQFRARGHYDKPEELILYFGAMMWLALVDFRFVNCEPSGKMALLPQQLVAAHLLRDAINAAGQRKNWDSINTLLNAFIGWSDNVTLDGFDRFIADAHINTPLDYLTFDSNALMDMLTKTDYGHQRIRGTIQKVETTLTEPIPYTISFILMGQRFTIESYLMQELVFDRLMVNGDKVQRPYPSPLDVMFVLGNNRALVHLENELAKYGYRATLDELRRQVNSYSHEYWQNTFYNLWLNAIRALNVPISSEHLPAAMQGDVWADKMLHTQLASWTQLRHDNILYAKQPYSPAAGCEYPVGYVEPYPAFYAALKDYARFGREIFSNLDLGAEPDMTYEQALEKAELENVRWNEHAKFMRPYAVGHNRDLLMNYFNHLEATADQLETLAHKELAGESFSEEDNLFLRSVVVRKYVGDKRYGGWSEEHWNGWYNDLLPFGDETPRLVADVHTNLNDRIGVPGVLHIGTGAPVALTMIHNSGERQMMYVGPAFTYYEHLEEGLPLKRLTDEEWRDSLSVSHRQYVKKRLASAREQLKNLPELIEQASDERRRDNLRESLAYHQLAVLEYEHELKQASIMPPAWTTSFRFGERSDYATLGLLPALYVLDLKSELWENLRASELYERQNVGEVAALTKLLRENRAGLLSIEGFTEEIVSDLIVKLREIGHWQDD